MERVEVAPGLSLSQLVYGMWRLADDEDRSVSHVRAKIDSCLEQGITTMDQADVYGDYESEAIFGAVLKQDPALRDRLEIVTKCGIKLLSDKAPQRRVKHYDTSPEHIRASVEASRRAMGIDVIDLLLVHRPDPLMDHHATGAALDAEVASGRVRAVGASNFRPRDWELLRSATETPLVANQIELSLLACEALTNGDLAFLQQRDVPVMAWSPLAGGRLVGARTASSLRTAMAHVAAAQGVESSAVALAWLLRHPARVLPVLGTNNLARIRRASEALRVELDRETWFELYTHAQGREVP